MADVALHVIVSGRVQGVFFRDFTRRRAAALRLRGWVRNLPDGSVEAVFVGTREACDRALDVVRVGPPHARVTDVSTRWIDPPPDVATVFEIRR